MLSLLVSASFAAPAPGAPAPFDLGEHARHDLSPPYVAAREHALPAPLPAATPGPNSRVYGYLAYWADDLQTVPWDQLSDIAIFAASADAQGNLTGTSNWDQADEAVAIAQAYDVKVHLCVTNFDDDAIGAFLASPTARQRLITALADWEARTGADGVNIDFEGLPHANKQQMVDFVRDLDAAVGDVVLATPAVDWSGAWDYSELSRHADLFIMGYGYHWSGSSSPGPVDPLYDGDPWSSRSLQWSIDDYLANDADPQRVILGLPLYGYAWRASDDAVPGTAMEDGDAVMWDDAASIAASAGRRYEPVTRTPWYWSAGKQGWYGDTDSLRERIHYAVEQDIAGVGFWALNYDGGDAAMWRMVDEETNTAPLPAEPGDFSANAGRPFLAYPGDRVILSAADSTGPDEALQYLWTQTAGPRVSLSDAAGMEPSFIVSTPGVHVFELRVGDGVTFSVPAKSYVIVIDREAGTSRGAGGCTTAAASEVGFSGMIGLLAAIALRARRRRTAR